MIGDLQHAPIQGIVISAVGHEGLSVLVNGKPARLAIIDDNGQVLAAGSDVAKEAEAVSVNSYRNFLKGQGFLRVLSKPLA